MAHDTRDQSDHDRGVRNEERLCNNDTKWVAHAQVHELEAQALRLQHEEYERRLEGLNNEAARIAGRDATYASREMVDGSVRELNQKIERNNLLLAAALPREVYDERHEALQGRVKELEGAALPREVFESTQKDVVLKAEALANAVQGKPSIEQHNALDVRLKTIELSAQTTADALVQAARANQRIQTLEEFKNRALGFGALIAILSGAVGAAVARAFGG